MKLEEIKAIVNKAGFSEVSLMALNLILDGAIKRGSMTAAEKKQALEIVDKEIDEGYLEMDAVADIAMAFTEFAEDVDQIDEMITNDLDEIERAAVEDMTKNKS